LQIALYRRLLRLRRRAFQAIPLRQFRKMGHCSSKLIREQERVNVPGPQFFGDYDFIASAQRAVTVEAPPLEIIEFANAAVMGGINIVLVGNQAVHADVIEPERDMFLSEVEGVAKFLPRKRKLYLPGPPLRPNSRRKTGRKAIAPAPHYRGADYYYFSNLMGVLGHELYFTTGAQIDQPEVRRLNRDYMANVQGLRTALERFCSR
jgi:hypothetical protein